jgi:hypothetical protein
MLNTFGCGVQALVIFSDDMCDDVIGAYMREDINDAGTLN